VAGSESLGGAAAAIDRAHLERLATRFGAHFVLQLIDVFIAQGRERIEAAERAATERDAEAIIAAAHALKSSAGNLGAGSLGECAAEIERRGRTGTPAEQLAASIPALRDLFAAACTALESARGAIERRAG
jgi:HPt (histidine-containing phosphotransfer) domain-containing protein